MEYRKIHRANLSQFKEVYKHFIMTQFKFQINSFYSIFEYLPPFKKPEFTLFQLFQFLKKITF